MLQALVVAGYLLVLSLSTAVSKAGPFPQRDTFAVLGDVAVAFVTGLVGGPTRWRLAELSYLPADPRRWCSGPASPPSPPWCSSPTRLRRRGAWHFVAPVLAVLVVVGLTVTDDQVHAGPAVARDYRTQGVLLLAAGYALGRAFLTDPRAPEPRPRRVRRGRRAAGCWCRWRSRPSSPSPSSDLTVRFPAARPR